MIDNNNKIIPLCIYHYIDESSGTFLGYIGNPEKKMSDDGKRMEYNCMKEKNIFNKWFLYGIFYVIVPVFRPIPIDMKLFCAKSRNEFPYETTDVYGLYDTYDYEKDCIYFISYNKPVPNTIPLYFHKLNNILFPSFDKNPPFVDKRWSKTEISPIFVFSSDDLKFKCVNGRCIPWSKNIDDMFDLSPSSELLDLDDCVVYCNKLSNSVNKGRHFNILEIVKSKVEEMKIRDNMNNKKYIFIICIIVIIIILLIIYKNYRHFL